MSAQKPLFAGLPIVWNLSAKWASKEIDCSLHGIENHCGAKCCTGTIYWPPKASGTGRCANLGERGCILGGDKPVTCLLYPFRLLGNSLVLHGRTLIPKSGYCAPCYKRGGKMIIEAVRGQFEILFGVAQADLAIANTQAGKDTPLVVPAQTLAGLKAELAWEERNETPPGRSQMILIEGLRNAPKP